MSVLNPTIFTASGDSLVKTITSPGAVIAWYILRGGDDFEPPMEGSSVPRNPSDNPPALFASPDDATSLLKQISDELTTIGQHFS